MKKVIVLCLFLLTAMAWAGEETDVDWKAKCEVKVQEIEGILQTLQPVVDFLTEAFENNEFSDTTTEEWKDAVTQFTTGKTYYEQAKNWMKEGNFNKKTFLKLEESWQYYVKTGVAGLRAKEMVGHELGKK